VIDNLIQIGTIVNVDPSNRALVRVKLFDRTTDWLPYKMIVNSHIRVWTPPKVDEQVIVLAPFGEGDDGIVLGGIYNKSLKEPTAANDHTSVVEFSDGTLIAYDVTAKSLTIDASGSVSVTAPSGITVTANTAITGNVTITGNLSVSGTITDEKGSLTSHVHSGVMSGGSNTGARP
jgi:phage baseplate assembly protein V